MTKQQKAHAKGLKAIKALEDAIDELKALGACPIDGRNGLLNLRSQLGAILKHRFPPEWDGISDAGAEIHTTDDQGTKITVTVQPSGGLYVTTDNRAYFTEPTLTQDHGNTAWIGAVTRQKKEQRRFVTPNPTA